MSNAIDRLEEMEGRATGGPWTPVHRCATSDDTNPSHGESGGLGWELSGPPEPQLRGHYANGYDAHLISALRNASKPLLAVVRAGEAVIATKRCDCYTYAPYHIGGCPIIEAEKALRLALATLKEAPL